MFKTQFERCERVYYSSDKPSLAKQSFKKECDVNHIMKKYEKTGVIEHAARYAGSYGDFTGADDYQDAVAKLAAADEAFMSLPASIRKRFNNSAGEYFDFVKNPANLAEMRELGLANKLANKLEENNVSEPEIQK